uniref:hypothetical protein n=1 Tax=Mycobacterium sp. HUMS_1102779 TaxID=3383487 RepID=UPI00389A39DC
MRSTGRNSRLVRATRGRVLGRVRWVLDGRRGRFVGRQSDGLATQRGLGPGGQVPAEAVEVFGQPGTGLADISQRAAGAGDPTGGSRTAPGNADDIGGLTTLLGGPPRRRSPLGPGPGLTDPGHNQHPDVKKVLPQPQSRPIAAPIIQMQQRSEHLLVGVHSILWVEDVVEQARPGHALPGGRRALRVQHKPPRIQPLDPFGHLVGA